MSSTSSLAGATKEMFFKSLRAELRLLPDRKWDYNELVDKWNRFENLLKKQVDIARGYIKNA